MTINERFQVLIKRLGLNMNSFAKEIGANSTAIYNIASEKGRKNNPSFEVLAKVLLTYENINANWLIRGEGSIFLDTLIEEDPVVYAVDKGDTSRNVYKMLEDLDKKVAAIQQEVEDLKNNSR